MLALSEAFNRSLPMVSGEIIVVDSHSTDRTVEIAESYGANVFAEDWKGFAVQKNSAIDKAQGDWIRASMPMRRLYPQLSVDIPA